VLTRFLANSAEHSAVSRCANRFSGYLFALAILNQNCVMGIVSGSLLHASRDFNGGSWNCLEMALCRKRFTKSAA